MQERLGKGFSLETGNISYVLKQKIHFSKYIVGFNEKNKNLIYIYF